MARKNRIDTKLEILRVACHFFVTEGYSPVSTIKIAKEVGITQGNLTFHFPTKEDLLAELIQYLCDYQMIVMEHEVEEGKTSLLAYLLELASIIAICDENEVSKDLYTAAYTHSQSLSLMRKADTEKVKLVFREFCPDWTDERFMTAENIVSGIEYASLLKENAEGISLDLRISHALDTVMRIYNVPKELRKTKLEKVLSMNYKRIGRRFVEEFTKYVEEVNEKALEEILERKKEEA